MKKLKTILKFDTGADGFKFFIIVGIIVAVLILVFGIVFLLTTFWYVWKIKEEMGHQK